MTHHDSTDNLTAWSMPVSAVHKPTTREDVVRLVREARVRGVALYPISTGFNWGYGSRSPTAAGCELVDLSGMRRILNRELVSSAHPVVVIEPGVTQQDLHEFLDAHHPGLTFNVTGSGVDTSIIGNALDRGVGYLRPRKEDLFGLEVVTGRGDVLRTGFRRLGDASPLADQHPYGLGPMLDGLFFQANFGIVVSACFQLQPRRPHEASVSLALRPGASLASFLDELAAMKREGMMSSVTHVGGRSRTHATVKPGVARYLEETFGMDAARSWKEAQTIVEREFAADWTSLGSVAGNRRQVRAVIDEIRQRTRHLARMRIVTPRSLRLARTLTHALRWVPPLRAAAAVLHAIAPLQDLSAGRPSDIAVKALLSGSGARDMAPSELDQSRCGLLFISPALPSDGRFTEGLMGELEQIARTHAQELHVTINLETATSMVAIINLLFDRSSPEETERAHRCAAALLAHIHAEGLEVYRARADMMATLTERDPIYWQTIKELKAVLDPDRVIAPGRYCPL